MVFFLCIKYDMLFFFTMCRMRELLSIFFSSSSMQFNELNLCECVCDNNNLKVRQTLSIDDDDVDEFRDFFLFFFCSFVLVPIVFTSSSYFQDKLKCVLCVELPWKNFFSGPEKDKRCTCNTHTQITDKWMFFFVLLDLLNKNSKHFFNQNQQQVVVFFIYLFFY